jgi:hypothetical protein
VLQVLQAGHPAANVALPISPAFGCTVVLTRVPAGSSPGQEQDAISMDVHADNVDANALMRYRALGLMAEAATTLEDSADALRANRLVTGEQRDPVAAAAGGYSLLRLNRLDRFRSWGERLYRDFPWLPDGAAIYGEYLARSGRHQEAAPVLLDAGRRGLPLFNEGLSFTLERLGLYLHATHDGPLDPSQLEQVRGMLERLQQFGAVTDCSKMLLRFTGRDPNTPGTELVTHLPAGNDPDPTRLHVSMSGGAQPGTPASVRSLPASGPSAAPTPAAPTPTTLGPPTTPPGRTAPPAPTYRTTRPTHPAGAQGAAGPATAVGGEIAMPIPDEVLTATAQRYDARRAERSATEQRIAEVRNGDRSILEVEQPGPRVDMRRRRVLAQPIVQETLAAGALENLGSVDDQHVLERIIGASNLLAIAFLELGARIADSVGRVHIRDQFRARGFGTGSMISPRLLLTNNHVLRSPGDARFSQVEFHFQGGLDGRPLTSHLFDLQPDLLFLTDPALDFTVVAVSGQSRPNGTSATVPLARFGFNRANGDQGTILLGESINIIQHPEGNPKQIALQQNELVDRLDDFLHYHTDTAPGSSGSRCTTTSGRSSGSTTPAYPPATPPGRSSPSMARCGHPTRASRRSSGSRTRARGSAASSPGSRRRHPNWPTSSAACSPNCSTRRRTPTRSGLSPHLPAQQNWTPRRPRHCPPAPTALRDQTAPGDRRSARRAARPS